MAEEYKESYSKRPLWQWIIIYLVIGAIIYGLIYYFAFYGKGDQTGGSTQPQQSVQQNPPAY